MTRLREADARRILGVADNATSAEIKQAYRDMLRMCHPDNHDRDPRLRAKAHSMTQDINAAYELLSSMDSTPARPPRAASAPQPKPSSEPTRPRPAQDARSGSNQRTPPDAKASTPPKQPPPPAGSNPGDIPCPKCRKATKTDATTCGYCWTKLPGAVERRRLDEEHQKQEAARARRSSARAAGAQDTGKNDGRVPCPFCGKRVVADATKCGFCWRELSSRT